MIHKQTFLKLHRWAGLALALFLVIQGATGMTMVFRDEIEPRIHPELIVQPLPVRAPVQALVDVAQPGEANRLAALTGEDHEPGFLGAALEPLAPRLDPLHRPGGERAANLPRN